MSSEKNILELEQAKRLAGELNIKYSPYSLTKISNRNTMFDIDNKVFFYPPNDGMPATPYMFYKNNKIVLDNKKAFSEIENIDEILLEMVKLYNKALDKKIVIDPYYFMLELTNKIVPNYHGRARLIITERAIRNQRLSPFNFDRANLYYINHFLDHFIGWNFGLSVNRNEELKNALHKLNNRVIDMNLRQFAGTGFKLYGNENEVIDGLQHYYLPTEKPNIKQLTTQ